MATKPNPGTVRVVRVVPTTGKTSYRAIGRAFPRTGTDIPVSELKPAQMKALKSDPWLVITELDIPVEAVEDKPEAGSEEAPQ